RPRHRVHFPFTWKHRFVSDGRTDEGAAQCVLSRPFVCRSRLTAWLGSEARRSLSELVLAAGQCDRSTTDEEEQGSRRQSAEVGTGTRQRTAGGSAVSGISVVAAVRSAAIGATGDCEGVFHGVVTAGRGCGVSTDVGRDIRRGAEDVDRGIAFVISRDGVLVRRDVDALRVDLEVDIRTGLAVLDGEGDALVLIGEVRGLDLLRGDREGCIGGSFGLTVVPVVAAILAIVIAVFVAVVPVIVSVFGDNVDVALEGLRLGAFTVDGDGERNLADLEVVG